MSDENERSVASTGSAVGEPMAWAVVQPDSYSVFVSKRLAEKRQELCMGGDIVPLYRHPQSTLTDAEREAVERAVGFRECTTSPLPTSQQIATLRGLLERL